MYQFSTVTKRVKTLAIAAGFVLAGAWLGGTVNAQHCTPTMQSKCCNMGTKNVTFGSQINYTIQNYDAGTDYYNEYNTISACVSAGTKHYMGVQVWNGNYNQAVCVWIDWNKNNTFDSGEEQFSTKSTAAGSTVSDSIDVPSGQASGDYRMRVMVDYYYYYSVLNYAFDPCQGYYYGDYVDFKITVVGTSGTDLRVTGALQPTVLTIGNNNTVQFGYKNLAGNSIDSFRAGYIFNGGSPVIENVSKHSNGNNLNLATCDADNYTFTNKFTVSSAGNYTLKIFISHPNGSQPDDDATNDTITVNACTALSGTYTIDGSQATSGTNYQTWGDAATALSNCGVAGPVLFKVAAGTYTENVKIGTITGASSTNNITFRGVDSTTELTSTSGNTLELDGADYVTFRKIMFVTTGTSNSAAVKLTSHADYNLFDSTWIVATSTQYSVVAFGVMGQYYYTTGQFGDYNTVQNSYLEGGYVNTIFNGDATTHANGNKLWNNTLYNCSQYMVYTQYQDTMIIADNKVNTGSATYAYAVYLGSDVETDLLRNEITSKYMGIYAYNNDYLDIINNIVMSGGFYGVYNYYNDNVNVWHNSILNTYSAGTGYCWYQYLGSAYDFRNNALVATGTSTYGFYANNASPFSVMEHNIINAMNSSNYAYMGQAYTNKAAFKGANSLNNVLYDGMPNWISPAAAPYDLHLTTAVQAISGDGTVGVTDDVDGDSRCTFAPSIGADESKFPLPAPVSNFTLPDTAYINSPFWLMNAAGTNDGKAFEWYVPSGSANAYSTARNVQVTFTSTGQQCVSLKTTNCTSSHDTTKCVYIVSPTQKPAADFLANKNTVEPFEPVMFTDLTTGGPVSWNWDVTPGTVGVDFDYINGTSSSSQNPEIEWYTPGAYNVCLMATNGVGTDTACKSAYIDVLPVEAMCQNSMSNAKRAKFYDDGGKAGNYSTNQTCSFLIDPCASSVTLTFKSFSTAANAYLKIYDGSSSNGKAFHTGNGFSGNTIIGPFTATSGRIFMEWKSLGAAGQGWEAEWTSVPGNVAKPSAAWSASSPGWVGGNHNHTVNYNDPNATYLWDDGQGNALGTGPQLVYTYQAAGTYSICLYATNCAGTDTVCKNIVIQAPTAAPTADFKANVASNQYCNIATSNTINVQFGDTVQLLDLSNQGANQWAWDVTPSANVVWVDTYTDQNPRVAFTAAGTYAVQLDATNGIGTGSTTKNAFIRVLPPYCSPAISQVVNDIGITQVKVASIDNNSTVNSDGYTDFSRKQSACIDRGAKYPMWVSRGSSLNPINRKVWIDWNQDGDFNDAGETVATQSSNNGLTWVDTLKVPTTATLGATRMRVGVSFGNNANNSCGPNNFGEFEDYGLYITEDVTPPVITLIGNSPEYIEKCGTYTDAGASAWDAVSGVINTTLVSNNVNTNTLGTYTVTWMAQDAAGNTASISRTVIVTPDKVGPVITLNGANPMKIDVNTSYTEPGATANDACDGNLPASSITIGGSVNTAVLGTYQITYDAKDYSGNAGQQVIRVVEVGVFTPPSISLLGNNPLTWPVGTAFVDPGTTVSSTYYTAGLTVTSNAATAVNTNILGTYTITYSCTDPSGNTGTATRTVNVVDQVAPVLNLIGNETLTVEAAPSGTWADLGAFANDNYWPNLSVNIAGTVDLSVLSTIANPYQMITYTATDGSGNTTTKTRYVEVKKTTKPVLTLINSKVVHVLRWHTYTDAGVTISDSYYSVGQLTPLATTASTVDMQNPGVYTYTHKLTDPSGNVADDAVRLVVVDDNIGISGVNLETDVTLFPNPTTGVFNLTIPADANGVTIRVMNALGQTVKVVEANKVNGTNLSVDMTGNASGMYFVSITSGNQTTVKKLKLLGN